jgi:hypothetical protein
MLLRRRNRKRGRDNELARERSAARKELGLCVKCGEPATGTLCEYHRHRNSFHCRMRYLRAIGASNQFLASVRFT